MPDNNYDDIEVPFNQFMVGVVGDKISVLRPSHGMSRIEAEEFAAWIVALCDTNMTYFEALVRKIQNS